MSFTAYVVEPCGRHGPQELSHARGLQEAVGGSICTVSQVNPETHGFWAYVNDEGVVAGLQENPLAIFLVRQISGVQAVGSIHGPLVLTSARVTRAENCKSLLSADMAALGAHFRAGPIAPDDQDPTGERTAENFRELLAGQSYLSRDLRVTCDEWPEGKRFPVDTSLDTQVLEPGTTSYWDGGVVIRLVDPDTQVYEILTTTVEAGRHVFSVCARVSEAGAMDGVGAFNAFGLGASTFDGQADVDVVYEDLLEKIRASPDGWWDQVYERV
jgi:hypothetical protein